MIQQHIIETDTVEKAVKNNNSFFFNKAKTNYQASKEEIQERLQEYFKNLSARFKLTTEKNMSDVIRERKKGYMKNCY